MLTNPLRSSIKYKSGVPVLPGSFPGVGHLPAFFADAPGLLQRGRQKLGPLFYLHMGPGLGWHPTCCGKEGFALLKNKALSNAHLAKSHSQFITERGLMALEGSAHQRLRGLMNAVFSPRGIEQHGVAKIIADAYRPIVESWATRRTVKVLADTHHVALDIIFQILDVPRDELDLWYKKYRYFAWSVLPLPVIDKVLVEPANKWLQKGLQALAQKARERPDGSSMLASMAHAKDENGELLSIDELVDNMRLLTFAGHETTSSAIAWATIELARAPEHWEALVAEVKAHPEAPMAMADLKAFPFAEALFRETLRLHPPIPLFSRDVVKPLQFAGHEIPVGELVYIPAADYCLDPETYKEPERFSPQRWLDEKAPPTPMENAVFGGGNHFCLGYHLALLEGVLFLWTLADMLPRHGLRPHLPSGAIPKAHHLPLSHPAPSTVVLF